MESSLTKSPVKVNHTMYCLAEDSRQPKWPNIQSPTLISNPSIPPLIALKLIPQQGLKPKHTAFSYANTFLARSLLFCIEFPPIKRKLFAI